jgi:hypothetical protein
MQIPGLPKIVAGILIAFVGILIAGLSGLSFYVWPTGFNDYKLAVTPEVIDRLRNLEAERKFGPDSTTFYPGAVNESERLQAQAAVDAAIRTLIAELPRRPQRSTVLRTMKAALSEFDTPESEERDQLLVYLTRAMEICGVDSSAELFNVWRYGFPYGWVF